MISMLHDIPSCAHPILGVEPDVEHESKALACTFIGGRSLAARLSLALLGVLLRS